MALTQHEINRRHEYHPPRPGTSDADNHGYLREIIKELALEVDGLFRSSSAEHAPREQACFHTALEEASFWAHAALARGRAE